MIQEKKLPVVLILLATYNSSKWLSEQIDSIINQKGVVVKILIRDDCSNDETVSSLNNLQKKYSFVSVIYADLSAGSPGANFKQLILKADLRSVDYVAFSDQDDIWFSNKLIQSIKFLKKSRAAGFSSSVLAFWPNGKKKKLSQSKKITEIDFLLEGAGQGCTFLIPSFFFSKIKKFCIKNKILINNFYYHDWLIYLLIRNLNETWYFSSDPTMFYRQHDSNDTGARIGFSAFIKRFSKIKSGWYKNQIDIALNISNSVTSNKSNFFRRFESQFRATDSIKRRIILAVIFLLFGRRRFADKFILAFSAIFGYI